MKDVACKIIDYTKVVKEERGMNDRIKKLRRQSIEAVEKISVERAKLLTEFYKNCKETSIPIKRAKAFEYILKNKTVVINDGELIVGERGEEPKATPTYPEINLHKEEDLRALNDRPKVSYKVSDEVIRIYNEEIIPFWEGKTIRDMMFESLPQRWKDAFEAGVFTEFMEQRAPGHTVLDGKIYKKGMLDFIKEIDEQLKKLNPEADKEALDKKEELEAMKIAANAIIEFAKRYAKKAEELAENESDPQRKKELLEIARICNKVPAHKPDTFHEALQYYWFVHLGVITELNGWDAFSPGKLDKHLYPFYKKDIEEGRLTKEKAKELLECLWVKFHNHPAPPKVGVTAEESSTYTDFAQINIGGIKEDGSDNVNELSYMLLDVVEEMRLVQPNASIHVSKKNPDAFIKRAIDIIKTGFGQPSVFNSDAVVQELLRQGKDIVDARCGGTSGCVESGAFGKENYTLTGYFNIPKVLEITLNNGIDPLTGKKIGLETGRFEDFKSFEDLMNAFKKQLKYFIDIKIEGNLIIERLYAKHMPAPFLSILIDDCIKKGKDYYNGGARYNSSYIQGVGTGTITDSLAAIKQMVFEDKIFTKKELKEMLDKNFEGFEIQRQILINKTHKYGNDDDYADSIMKEVFEEFFKNIDGRPTYKGGQFRINMLPTTVHVYFGSKIGATPDGRLAFEPISEGISPVQGMDKNGPTAVLKSAAKMDHIKTGGTLLNIKFTPDLLKDQKGIDGMVRLIRTYFKLDGHHVQFNVASAETLKDAKKHPEKYGDLIVRVAGYSDYFCHLNEKLQDEIIRRTEHESF
ncbi:trans-4-hydroxy-L-proline dehydratase [Hippea maritima]|uniref:Pyruvate formate-lyase n=1 Tax=Hippea maritima (strain ATCC 700847 / DSM 10411 / MH2) TaxID=760142 RepID=F2LTL4_HIPMA|nr:trans-4-hydroxy-L-proline dehydratase [Hippea maritima]AEA33339.1 pyruvate formate-lyase [Hippea maritima DSM 10411]